MTSSDDRASAGPVLTADGAWQGGVYVMTVFYALDVNLDAALESFWSFSALRGPVLSKETEPTHHNQIVPCAADGGHYGVLALPGRGHTACQTNAYVFHAWDYVPHAIPSAVEGAVRHQDGASSEFVEVPKLAPVDVVSCEVHLSIPLGSLARAWPEVGSFPFGVTHAEVEAWEPRLERLLVDLAAHAHGLVPFRRAHLGFEGIFDEFTSSRPLRIPEHHVFGIIDGTCEPLAWHPPTSRGGFAFEVPARHAQRSTNARRPFSWLGWRARNKQPGDARRNPETQISSDWRDRLPSPDDVDRDTVRGWLEQWEAGELTPWDVMLLAEEVSDQIEDDLAGDVPLNIVLSKLAMTHRDYVIPADFLILRGMLAEPSGLLSHARFGEWDRYWNELDYEARRIALKGSPHYIL
jgi:hypothetical protein